jgi:hypothetical protein
MANKLPNELVVSGTGDGTAKLNVEDLAKILSGADPSAKGSDTVVIKLNLPTSNPGAGILWVDGVAVKVGT